jgi:hypothetical protein
MTQTNDDSMRTVFEKAVQDTPPRLHPLDKLSCENCGDTFEGIELLLDVHGCARCPGCCSAEVITNRKHNDLWYAHRCPSCKGGILAVVVKVWAVLTEGGTETDHDICPDHDHEWDGDSLMACLSCDYTAAARNFDPTHQKEEK